MRKLRSLRFDALEDRKLMTASHAATAHHAANPAAPLVLNGTLTVHARAETQTQNIDGSSTILMPVTGTIATLGKVHGQWAETTDAYGDYQGPDTIGLSNPKGSVIIAFNNANPGTAHPNGPKAFYYQHPQVLYTASGAYKHSTESGTIDINTNASKSDVTSITLTSK
jgi:hypothetical protein